MNLTYKVLWIEDNEQYVEALNQDFLEAHLHGHGFDLELQFRTSPEEIALDVDGTAFDLMVIDYQITEHSEGGDEIANEEDEKTGDKVIKAVRDHDCLTEVIFYSGAPTNELRQIAATRELEGVFFSDRDPEVLLRKVCDVFDLTVRKVVDVNNMRGIVMAGVVDIDHQLADLLRELHNQLDDGAQKAHHMKLFKKMLQKERSIKKLIANPNPEEALIKNLHSAIKALEGLAPKDFDKIIEEREFDSHGRVEATSSLCGTYPKLAAEKSKLDEIKQLLKWRNALAHQRPITKDGVQIFEPDEGVPEPFDAARTLDLRKKLREHTVHLDGLLASARKNE